MKRYERNWLVDARSKTGMTQAELAKACSCDPSYIWQIEAGWKTPNVHLGLRITNVLGLNPYSWLNEKLV